MPRQGGEAEGGVRGQEDDAASAWATARRGTYGAKACGHGGDTLTGRGGVWRGRGE